jgi:exonuclease III
MDYGCQVAAMCEPAETPGKEVRYQTDYLFASPKLASALVSCEVRATQEWFEISDHAPIVAEFR